MMEKSVVHARLIELCASLTEATAAELIQWVAREESSFLYEGANGAVEIRSRDRDGEAPFELIVYNPKMETVDTVLSEWSASEEPAAWNEPLFDLYRAARRRALGVDKLIEALTTEVRNVSQMVAP
jgi:hypothetical protein